MKVIEEEVGYLMVQRQFAVRSVQRDRQQPFEGNTHISCRQQPLFNKNYILPMVCQTIQYFIKVQVYFYFIFFLNFSLLVGQKEIPTFRYNQPLLDFFICSDPTHVIPLLPGDQILSYLNQCWDIIFCASASYKHIAIHHHSNKPLANLPIPISITTMIFL